MGKLPDLLEQSLVALFADIDLELLVDSAPEL